MIQKYAFPLVFIFSFVISLINDSQAQIIKKLQSANPPTVDFTYSPGQICVGDTVTFTDLSTNSPTQWYWEFTNAVPATSTAQNPKVIYVGSGSFDVKLRATNSFGTDSLLKSNYVFVQAAPSLSVVDPGNFCENEDVEVALQANRYDGIWETNNWNSDSDTVVFNPINLNVGVYSLTYSLASSNGCVSTDTANFEILSAPTVLMAPFDTICQGDDIFTLANGTPAGGFYKGAGVSNGEMDPSKVGSGVYAVRYIYTSPNGCTDSAYSLLPITVCPSVGELSTDQIFSVFPNPANERVNLAINNDWKKPEISVWNLTGEKIPIDIIQVDKNNYLLDINGLATGAFFIKVCGTNSTNNSCKSTKLIKLP